MCKVTVGIRMGGCPVYQAGERSLHAILVHAYMDESICVYI